MSPAKNTSPFVLLRLLLILVVVQYVQGHARLIRPPSRASMWRLGYPMRNNDYNDNEGYCGGSFVQHNKFGGKCGVCGDPWSPIPRAHERGGKYYEGTITGTYEAGSILTATVQVTAGHKGYFEFRVCPYDHPEVDDLEYYENGTLVEVSQSCLDKHLLTLVETHDTKFFIPHISQFLRNITIKLPDGLSCKKCLFQWTYVTGNSWGIFKNGTSCIGCGAQETFKACSDIVIKPKSTSGSTTVERTERTTPSKSPTTTTTSTSTSTTTTSTPSSTPELTTQENTIQLSDSSTTEDTKWRATDVPLTTLGKWTRILKSSLGTTSSLEADEPTKDETNTWYSWKFSSTTAKAAETTAAPTTAATRTTLKIRKCKAVGVWKMVAGIPQWCINNCRRGFCPKGYCSEDCKYV